MAEQSPIDYTEQAPLTSIILTTATRFLFPLLLLFSVFVTTRGHQEPGGGFVGGLVAAAAFALYTLDNGVPAAERVMHVRPRTLIASGLTLALSSATFSLLLGDPFMTGQWSNVTFPVLGRLSTPAFFDFGVYFVVIGVVSTIIFTLFGEENAPQAMEGDKA